MESQTVEVVEHAGWRMYRPTYEALMAAKRTAKPAVQPHMVTEGQTGKAKAAPALKEDATDALFRILSDDYSAPRCKELSEAASEQLWSAVCGDSDYKPTPAKVTAENLAYRAAQTEKATREALLVERLSKCFSADEFIEGDSGSNPSLTDKLYSILR